MLIAAIITGSLAFVFGALWATGLVEDGFGDRALWPAVLFFLLGFAWLVLFLVSMKWQPGSSQLTGYIYSSDTTGGYTRGHIRFSENAGTDQQPSFCAKSDSKAAHQITELAGSGKKVTVNIPSYFYFSNNPFACGTTDTQISEVK